MQQRNRATFGSRLRALRVARGLSQVELARAIGRHQTAIGPYERDDYAPSPEIVEKVAATLGTSPEFLLFGRSPNRRTLVVAGVIGSAGLVDKSLPELEEPVLLGDEHMVSYRLADDSMAPVFRPGQLVLVTRVAVEEVESLFGRDALAQLSDGRIMLRRLFPGAVTGRVDLAAYNAPLLPSVAVESARPVLGTLWPSALAEPEEAGALRELGS